MMTFRWSLLLAAPLLAVLPFSAVAQGEPEPDREDVEASFRAAVITEHPAADTSLLNVACAVEPSAVSWRVACFASFLDGTSQYIVTGIAPERDPVEGPTILDPMAWPWEITVVSDDGLGLGETGGESPDFSEIPAQIVSDAFGAVVLWEPLFEDNPDLLVLLAWTAADVCSLSVDGAMSTEMLDVLIESTMDDESMGEVVRSVVRDTCGDQF